MGVVREFFHSFSIAHARVSRELGVEWTPARVTRFWMRMVVLLLVVLYTAWRHGYIGAATGGAAMGLGRWVSRTLFVLIVARVIGALCTRTFCRWYWWRDGRRMDGQRVVVTGANTGIGLEAAYQMAVLGADVTIACRSPSRGESARVQLQQRLKKHWLTFMNTQRPVGTVRCMTLDLDAPASIRTFAASLAAAGPKRLDVLVLNAGRNGWKASDDAQPAAADADADASQLDYDGVFRTNFLGHFLLLQLLLPLLTARAHEAQPPARVVCLSSVMHRSSSVEEACSFLRPRAGGARQGLGYSASKMAMLLLAS